VDGGVRFEASLCYVRGLLYANRNNFDKAKESYKEALRLDIKCFEALDQLTKNTLLKPREGGPGWCMINKQSGSSSSLLILME